MMDDILGGGGVRKGGVEKRTPVIIQQHHQRALEDTFINNNNRDLVDDHRSLMKSSPISSPTSPVPTTSSTTPSPTHFENEDDVFECKLKKFNFIFINSKSLFRLLEIIYSSKEFVSMRILYSLRFTKGLV